MKKLILVLAAVLASASLSAPASAQQYPDRAIKMIVPWAAGGDTDNIFRPAGAAAAEAPGPARRHRQRHAAPPARSARARPRARRPTATPSMPCTTTSTSCTTRASTDISYKDFEPICLVSATPSVLTASPKTPWKDWAGVPGRRQEAARRDHGRRHAELDQPHLPGHRSRRRPASSSSTCPTRAWRRA